MSEEQQHPETEKTAENPLESISTMVLAAGLGTRVQPLSESIPKALLPVYGRPLLEWNLRFLAQAGISHVVVNAHHLTDSVENWLDRELRPEFDVDGIEIPFPRVQLVKEPVLLGGAGGIANASPLLSSDPVLIWNVDLLFQPDLRSALQFHRDQDLLATLLLVRDPQFSKVALEGSTITSIAHRADPADASLWAYTGIALLSQKAILELPTGGFEPLPPHLRRWAAAGQLAGFRSEATFREVGSLEGYWEIHRELAGPLRQDLLVGETRSFSREPGGFGFIAAGATVSPNSHVEESIILGGAEVAAGSDVRRSILGPGAHVDSTIENVAMAEGQTRALALLPYRVESHLDGFLSEHMTTWPKETRRELKKTRQSPRIRRIQGGGSGRQIFRVTAGPCSRIAVLDPPAEESANPQSIYPVRALRPEESHLPTSLDSFLYVRDLLDEGGVRVPRLLATDLELGLVLLEDLGLQHLADQDPGASPEDDAPGAAPPVPIKLYEEAIDILLRIQELTPDFDPNRVQNPTFDPSFGLEYEGRYFLRQFVPRMVEAKAISEESADSQPLEDELTRLARAALGNEAPTLIHRDFQSRNLMVRHDHLIVIDFQGARIGPATYDLASLLYDPYNNLDARDRDHLLERYMERRQLTGPKREATESALNAVALQRLLQNLGAFAYLGEHLQKAGFWKHVPVALARAITLARVSFPSLERLLTECATNLESSGVEENPPL